MTIAINNWVVFEVFSDDELTEYFGGAVSGFVTNACSPRLELGERVCTAGVTDICMNDKLVRTKSGETFNLKGNGQFVQLSIGDFDSYSRTGYSEKLFKNHLSMDQVPPDIKNELNLFFKNNEKLIVEWLVNPKRPLNGQAPIEVLATEEGIKQVLDMLERMRTGDFS
ncbi:MbcA/ParS/Xre antitoxin family protein [Litorilituus lipolyticus]|uniref:DUF2384 domain-containing protein n=1 Tax=Litorilituus lipolyticus TaxID=2491017 RepID=A0A502LD97_9GAMM|nr:MbcA/ParS/Xre antitoxin family protein [Litorilituus lipolyticus]TPH18087.1 DUF2384 domain-containing protein [Litorilituus lipolyticus]